MVRLAVLAAAVLAACPAAAAEDWLRWTLLVDERGAVLSYGSVESEDVRVYLGCDRGTGRLRLAFPVERRVAKRLADDGNWLDADGRPAPWPAEVGIEAGVAAQAFDAQLHDYELNEGSMAVAEIATTEVRELLAAAGENRNHLAFYAASPEFAEPLHEKLTPPPVPLADLDALLAACG